MQKDNVNQPDQSKPVLSERQPAPSNSVPHKSSTGKILIWLAVILLIGAGAFWVARQRKNSSSSAKGGPAGRGATGPVPVVAGTVEQKDIPLYLDGLGTVQALNTVTVRSRVDGQLQKVAFNEGQDVAAGDVLVEIDPLPFLTQLRQNEAKKSQDEAQLANAKIDLARNESLVKQKIVAQSVYDTAQALANQLEATVKADQAAIDSAQVQLNYATVRSPINGRTGIRMVDVGNIVHANDANGLVIITQLKPISVVFTLPEQHLGSIHKEMLQGELKVLAVNRDNKTVLAEGKLAVIDNQIDPTTGTIKLKATFPNENLELWPGQFVNARLLLAIRKNGLVVPASVVQQGPEGTFAFVINEDQSVKMQPIKVDRIQNGVALINEGLRPGERVVVDGQYKLQNGSKIQVNQGSGREKGNPAEASPARNGGGNGKPGEGRTNRVRTNAAAQ